DRSAASHEPHESRVQTQQGRHFTTILMRGFFSGPDTHRWKACSCNAHQAKMDALLRSSRSMEPRILVVDDNEDNRFTLSMRLEASGYSNLAMAANGREALEVMRAESVDLVLLDIMMPELDGYGVLEAMQADASLRALPVLVVSAVDEIASV